MKILTQNKIFKKSPPFGSGLEIKIGKIALIGVLFSSHLGCSLRSPSYVEQQQLIAKGSFPSGIPAWVASPLTVGVASNLSNSNGVNRSGLIPVDFSPPAVSSGSGSGQALTELSNEGERERITGLNERLLKAVDDPPPPPHTLKAEVLPQVVEKPVRASTPGPDVANSPLTVLEPKKEPPKKIKQEPEEKAVPEPERRQPASKGEIKDDQIVPLERISKLCPKYRAKINEALTTTDRVERSAKYERLTVRCSVSPDLWVFLGKDYLDGKFFLQAAQSFERALWLDRSRVDARRLLREAKEEAKTHKGR